MEMENGNGNGNGISTRMKLHGKLPMGGEFAWIFSIQPFGF